MAGSGHECGEVLGKKHGFSTSNALLAAFTKKGAICGPGAVIGVRNCAFRCRRPALVTERNVYFVLALAAAAEVELRKPRRPDASAGRTKRTFTLSLRSE